MSFFGHNIKFWRKHMNLSQAQFAIQLGTNRGKIATYEESVEPRYDFLLSLVQKFNVNLHSFLTRKMTDENFNAFFIQGDDDADAFKRKTSAGFLEKLMALTEEDSKVNRRKLKDELILEFTQLTEENHGLREDFLLYVKSQQKS